MDRPLIIPPSGFRRRSADDWPTHAGKARRKRASRERRLAELAREAKSAERSHHLI